jgi:hypothetical protein
VHKYVISAFELTTYFCFLLAMVFLDSCMHKSEATRKDSVRRERKDGSDALDVRGAGATWQADFGMALNEADLLFSVRQEPVANRIVFQVANDVFDNWFRLEEVSDKPDPNFDQEVPSPPSMAEAAITPENPVEIHLEKKPRRKAK